MKNTILISPLLLLFLTSMVTLNAQDLGTRRPLAERIEAQRIAFITDKVNLTPEEAQVFWPIYNDYRDKTKELKERKTPTKSVIDMNDEEAMAHIEAQIVLEREELEVKVKLMEDLKAVISPRKILRFFTAERQFKERLLQIMNQRRRQQNTRK